ncbi:MAG: cytochrome c oxidase accessory protein CcoG [Flavobacteriales bacterium]|nr:cytochrome c oxidase accessory protein CcoG [Flavobacteriales bacterium]
MTEQESSSVLQPKGFRDSIGTMEQSGSRKWIFPKKPKGKFTNYRTYVSWVLLAILFVVPFVKVNNGNPLFLFNVLNREFFIFGFPFYLQDFYLIAIGMVTSIVFIVLFTVVFGRIFCGWICPQTIFLEMVFRKIEYLIDGDRNKQIRLSKQKWDAEKIKKRTLKWTIFFIISFVISNMFLAYIIGIDALERLIVSGPIKHYDTFIALLIFTVLFFFVFAWFREQACTLVCPYGRLQGVLIDQKTINVAYDFVRGEGENGRSKWRNGEDRESLGKGDCIDCNQCVVVCPTGIDIRDGSQLECVNCTACIDACDEVMEKVGLPKGLIRYASEDEIKKKEKFKFTGRMYAYTAVLLLLMGLLISLLFMRSDVDAKILRQPGSNYIEQDGVISNQYQYTLINKTNKPTVLHFRMVKPSDAQVKIIGSEDKITLKPRETKQGTLVISIVSDEVNQTKEKIEIAVFDENEKMIDTFDSTFAGPLRLSF